MTVSSFELAQDMVHMQGVIYGYETSSSKRGRIS
jgi:hypothetical protein